MDPILHIRGHIVSGRIGSKTSLSWIAKETQVIAIMILTIQATFPTVDEKEFFTDIHFPETRSVNDVPLRALSSPISFSRSWPRRRACPSPLLWSWW